MAARRCTHRDRWDAVDIIIFQLTDFPATGYHRADKLLDAWYMALFAVAAQRWPASLRWTATALFAYRLAGVVAYEATGARILLFIFPNVFEFFFLYCAAALQLRPGYALTARGAFVVAAVLLVPKLAQEYALHYAQWLDNLVAVEIIEDVARAVVRWLRDPLP
jgi:hypothetical protein